MSTHRVLDVPIILDFHDDNLLLLVVDRLPRSVQRKIHRIRPLPRHYLERKFKEQFEVPLRPGESHLDDYFTLGLDRNHVLTVPCSASWAKLGYLTQGMKDDECHSYYNGFARVSDLFKALVVAAMRDDDWKLMDETVKSFCPPGRVGAWGGPRSEKVYRSQIDEDLTAVFSEVVRLQPPVGVVRFLTYGGTALHQAGLLWAVHERRNDLIDQLLVEVNYDNMLADAHKHRKGPTPCGGWDRRETHLTERFTEAVLLSNSRALYRNYRARLVISQFHTEQLTRVAARLLDGPIRLERLYYFVGKITDECPRFPNLITIQLAHSEQEHPVITRKIFEYLHSNYTLSQKVLQRALRGAIIDRNQPYIDLLLKSPSTVLIRKVHLQEALLKNNHQLLLELAERRLAQGVRVRTDQLKFALLNNDTATLVHLTRLFLSQHGQ